jgi:type I restriction enzyme S subunit
MQRYLFFWLDLPEMTSEIVSLNSNSAQPGINQVGARQLPLLRPANHVVQAFDRVIAPMTDALFQGCRESCTLAALRDTLLPKLISGELRIRDVERMVGDAT